MPAARLIGIELDELDARLEAAVRRVLAEQSGAQTIGTKEAAKILNCSSRTVDAYEKQGFLRNYGTGRTKKYRRLDVIELSQRRSSHAVQS